jgi:hypothetical protein
MASVSRKEIVRLFGGTDPVEVERALTRAAERLSLRGDVFDRSQLLAVLDEMISTTGVVGVVARFAKARALLLPKAPAATRR